MDNDEIKELKSILRSLVVSSPAQVDVRSLLRDYRNMVGAPVPITKFGYRDPVEFLKDRCDDCFLFQGPSTNPILTLIVPETLKHIDKFVKSQKVSVNVKFKGKRRSVPESIANPPHQNLIAKTFSKPSPVVKEKTPENIAPNIITNYKSVPNLDKKNLQNGNEPNESTETSNSSKYYNFMKKRTPHYNSTQHVDSNHSHKGSEKVSSKDDTESSRQTSSTSSSTKLAKLEELKAEIREVITSHPDGVLCTDLIGLYRERYNRELNFTRFGYTSIAGLVCAVEGVSARPAPSGDGDLVLRDAATPAPLHAHSEASRSRARLRPRPLYHSLAAVDVDVDDALPGIDFDADVFPADCMHFMETIPASRLDEATAAPGAMLAVIVGEVYSPSHFWLLRLGEQYNLAMEDMMDDMTTYYTIGEGKDRCLALGAVRVGHYCSSVYERDWHRSLIVKVIDSDTVKVRHVDYGTVDTVSVSMLKPLRRVWSQLPAQAYRARLAGVRPAAAGRRWPRAACTHLLNRVRDRRLVACLVAHDLEDQLAEVLLIDTSLPDEVNIGDEMIRLGHADSRPDSALQTSECYLYPRFEALENGDTPNYAEIHGYLRDGIALEFVDAYRRYVPSCLPGAFSSPPPEPAPPPAPAPAPSPAPAPTPEPARAPTPPPPVELVNRVPLMHAPLTPPAQPTSPEQPASPAQPASLAQPASPAQPTSHSQPASHSQPVSHSQPASHPQSVSHLQPSRPAPYSQPPPYSQPAPHDAYYSPHCLPPHRAPAPFVPPPMMAPYPGAYPPVPPMGCFPPYGPPQPPRPGLGPWSGVTLSAAECEVYRLLCRVDPNAAHWYMVDAIERARAGLVPVGSADRLAALSKLNPAAPEFRMVTEGTQTEAPPPPRDRPARCAPPPGFENH